MVTPRENDSPLMYSVSFYRNQKMKDYRPPVTRVVHRAPVERRSPSPEPDKEADEISIRDKIRVWSQSCNLSLCLVRTEAKM